MSHMLLGKKTIYNTCSALFSFTPAALCSILLDATVPDRQEDEVSTSATEAEDDDWGEN